MGVGTLYWINVRGIYPQFEVADLLPDDSYLKAYEIAGRAMKLSELQYNLPVLALLGDAALLRTRMSNIE